MPDEPVKRLAPRMRRILELVYSIEGVGEARVWEWDQKIAVGVRATATTSPSDLLKRIESQIVVVREPGETWTFGLLED